MLRTKSAVAYMETWNRKVFGEDIAARLNCHYDGIQEGFGYKPDIMQFTDNVTGSTLYGNTYEEVRDRLETMRNKFERVK